MSRDASSDGLATARLVSVFVDLIDLVFFLISISSAHTNDFEKALLEVIDVRRNLKSISALSENSSKSSFISFVQTIVWLNALNVDVNSIKYVRCIWNKYGRIRSSAITAAL